MQKVLQIGIVTINGKITQNRGATSASAEMIGQMQLVEIGHYLSPILYSLYKKAEEVSRPLKEIYCKLKTDIELSNYILGQERKNEQKRQNSRDAKGLEAQRLKERQDTEREIMRLEREQKEKEAREQMRIARAKKLDKEKAKKAKKKANRNHVHAQEEAGDIPDDTEIDLSAQSYDQDTLSLNSSTILSVSELRVSEMAQKSAAISEEPPVEQFKKSVSVESSFIGLHGLSASENSHEKTVPIVQMKKSKRAVVKAAAGGVEVGKLKTQGIADLSCAKKQAQFPILPVEQSSAAESMKVARAIISSAEDKASWIWQLFHGKYLKYDNIVRDFIRSSQKGIFQQFKDDVSQEALASTERYGHHVIFSLRSPADGKIYSEGAHVVHGSALKINWPSWRHALVRLLKRAGIVS